MTDGVQFQDDQRMSPSERLNAMQGSSPLITKITGGLIRTENGALIFGIVVALLGIIFLLISLFGVPGNRQSIPIEDIPPNSLQR